MPNYSTINDNGIWLLISLHQGEPFTTSGRGSRLGKQFTYTIKGGEMFISAKEKSITKATVVIAYEKALQIQRSEGCVSGPKRIGTFGASYLYPIFLRLGVITRTPMDSVIFRTESTPKEPCSLDESKDSHEGQYEGQYILDKAHYASESLTPQDQSGIIIEADTKEGIDYMPRPKGSKNKKSTITTELLKTNFDERIAETEATITALAEELKGRKAELKQLMKMKDEAERIAAEKKAEEDKAKVMEALAASGKSVDEVLEFLKS